MPVQAPIEDIIAFAEFVAVTPSGESRKVRVEIGRPYWKDELQAVCPSALWGIGGRERHDVFGADTLQALSLAIRINRTLVEHLLDDGWQLFFAGDGDSQKREPVTAVALNAVLGPA